MLCFPQEGQNRLLQEMGTNLRAAKESAPIRRIMAMDHPVDVIQNIFARAEDILDVVVDLIN